MDFFERQDRARRNTWLLALYFLLAVALIVVAVNAAFYLFFKFTEAYPYTPRTWFSHTVWLYVTAGTLLVILLGSVSRFVSLAGGGKAVAEMAGARLVDLNTANMNEKKYINVVAEMAIASGVPMPVLYVLDDESGINAFVAGYRPTEAVMVVTQGALEALDRDELQGVVGHEFSHILNGDMRINIRLMAILAGILIIGQIGQFLLRGSGRRHYISRSGKNNGQGALIVLAIALLIIGYVGLFFGRLIKAAISRQREFLADASSVQFTRNARGIAGALYKIKQNATGSLLQNKRAEDMSHMCFGETLHVNFQRLLATHPPLETRINEIDPGFLKIQNSQQIVEKQNQLKADEKAKGFSAANEMVHTSVQAVTDSVGNPGPEHMLYAAAMLQSLPSPVMSLVHEAQGAKAIVYALILTAMDRTAGLKFLHDAGEGEAAQLVEEKLSQLLSLDKRLRLSLIDLLLPSLKRLGEAETAAFLETGEALIKLDKKYTLFEFVLFTILNQHLNPQAERADKIRFYSFKPVLVDIQLILSVLCHSSQQSAEKKQQMFQRGLSTFTQKEMPLLSVKQFSIKTIRHSLNRLCQLSPMLKKSVINACADVVIDDGIMLPEEAELLRAVAESLDCPIPPFVNLSS
ncbi:MAG: M48 family metallopeptidase [Gammaproteobacteria bacterium]|nr:M48 family metallopeptidase [Gammaproteobacteria bacterium]